MDIIRLKVNACVSQGYAGGGSIGTQKASAPTNPCLSYMADAVVYTDSNDLMSNLLLFSIWDVWMP